MLKEKASFLIIVSSSNPEPRNFREEMDPIYYHKCMYNQQ